MKSFFFLLSQLSLVTIVYVFAYRAGYRSAQSKAMSVVKKFADPVTSLLDQLNASMEEATGEEGEPPASDSNRSARHPARKSAFGGSNEKTNVEP